ncbi:hypothetical protein [Nocardia amamiensis]|nr:hypothetical protein [Nocardia amamiensis]
MMGITAESALCAGKGRRSRHAGTYRPGGCDSLERTLLRWS